MQRMSGVPRHRRRVEYLWIAGVFLAALVPRVIGIGDFLTADEDNWTGRGWEFITALREFRFNDTLLTTHPGIPTLWVSGLTSLAVSGIRDTPFSFDALRTYVTAGRIVMAILNSLLIAGIFWAVRGMVDPRIALLGSLAIALDPFLVSHGKLVHVDGLLAGTTVLALLLFLRAVPALPIRPGLLIASAIMSGLAILAKLPALLLVPLVALTLAVAVRNAGGGPARTATQSVAGGRPPWRGAIRAFGQWLAVAAATILILWPGLLWVPDPVGNVKIVKRDLVVALSTPHHMADNYTLNPWQYPATLLARTTIPTLAGFVLFLFFLFRATGRSLKMRAAGAAMAQAVPARTHPWAGVSEASGHGSPPEAGRASERPTASAPRWGARAAAPGDGPSERPAEPSRQDPRLPIDLRTAWLLVAFIVLFILGMTLGAKKGDRYLLPVFPVLDIFATLGIVSLLSAVGARWRPAWWTARRRMALAAAVLLAPLSLELILLGPYTLAHYNRLFAPNLSQELGWGEGLDQVAQYLNGLDDGGRVVAASWYPEELRALVDRSVQGLGAHRQVRTGYVVLYRNMFGRPPDHPANDYLDEYYRKRTPVFTARVNGLEYAWVYRLPVYSAVVPELTPQKLLVAELPTTAGHLTGVEAYLATYNGRANEGALVLRLRREPRGPDLHVSRHAIQGDEDNQWVRFEFPSVAVDGKAPLTVLLSAEGTAPGRAPAIRFAARETDAARYGLGETRASPAAILATGRGRGQLGIRPVMRADER